MIRISDSVEETIEIGADLAKRLKRGDVVALIGNLGSGKTVLTKGIAQGLGVKDPRYVNSPSFVIIKEYSATKIGGSAFGGKGKLPLYHFDLYRVDKANMIDPLSYEEYFYGDGVTVIEWADKIRKLLPAKYIEVKLSMISGNKRRIEIKAINSPSP